MKTLKSSTAQARLLVCALTGFIAASTLGFVGAAQAGPLPVLIDFTGDTPGAAPALGGTNQPTSITLMGGATALVQASANGLATQPLQIAVGAKPDPAVAFGFVPYSFDTPVSSQIVRVEATMSISTLFNGFIFSTSASNAAAVTILTATAAGEIRAQPAGNSLRPLLGTYAANNPFRIRMDIDVSNDSWSFALDDELDGFLNDPIISGLIFSNDPAVIPDVGSLDANLNPFGGSPAISVAYDDISASVLGASPIPEPATLAIFGLGLAGLGFARRRKAA